MTGPLVRVILPSRSSVAISLLVSILEMESVFLIGFHMRKGRRARDLGDRPLLRVWCSGSIHHQWTSCSKCNETSNSLAA
ncbi:uncharacterized protein BCR38DRAFT_38843 [Pseudomassariella vexata]|uniref:Uncharacterized protein n=1 Tax=Pseudomassariella vexata TaxID=1141098 RepID=A0A1Y2DRK6_9PEZI|nr:uncharacterized protein BCR38DRAFT_38843 [Pseudomassariella vexata]ORY61726.1 hypothetical protein BCR38DRAFT_38843 [Pseudomassariella vexata]